jgi:hypothetical protein
MRVNYFGGRTGLRERVGCDRVRAGERKTHGTVSEIAVGRLEPLTGLGHGIVLRSRLQLR